MSAKIGARSHPVYQRLCDLKKSGNAGRYGLLFSTQFKNYFYDTGTGKVLHIGDYEFKALQAFFDPTISLDAFEKRCHQMAGDRLEKFLTTIDSEKLLCAPPVTAMHLASDDNWLEALDSDLQQLVLEVTEACNFRCKYCIYNEDYEGNRDFGTAKMPQEIAQKAIDYLAEHSSSHFAVTFYGGEPLANFPLVRWATEYTLEHYKDKHPTFNLTTNLTLVTDEIADFLARTPGFSVVVSLDGPEEVQNSNKHYYKKFCRLNTVYAMAQDSVSLLLKIAIIMQAVTQKLTIGAASMYISSVDSFNASFQGMLSQISTLYEQTRYLSYISDIENISVRKQEEGTPLTEKIKSIRFENVSFHYPNSHNMVLKNFSYTFETGKTYALVGMNGSGKTTLIKLLMRLYTPINGHIYVNGVDIEEISFSSLQQQISAVFQDFIRYPFNVAENIAIHDADNINDFERVKEAAVHSEATEFIDALPLGYRTTLEKEWNGGTELSGGQWQKIAIARCFYKSSSVVILDEPFSAIDSFSEEQIIKSLASDTINKMCIFVTHRFNNICLADQILVLKDAQLIENGTHAQLMATNGLYARLYHAQADAFFTLSQSEVQEE